VIFTLSCTITSLKMNFKIIMFRSKKRNRCKRIWLASARPAVPRKSSRRSKLFPRRSRSMQLAVAYADPTHCIRKECRILRTSFPCNANSTNGRLVSSHSGIASDSPRIATAPVACIPKRESRSYRPVRVRSGALSQRVSQERSAIDKPSSFFCLGQRQDSGPDWS
jgi:hypothetical protein